MKHLKRFCVYFGIGFFSCSLVAGETQLTAGWNHALALTNDGRVIGWGSNQYGQSVWPTGNQYVQVSAGSWFTLALRQDGLIDTWGYNRTGQLGNGETSNSSALKQVYGLEKEKAIAIAAGGSHGLALLLDGTVLAWGDNNDGQLGDGTTTSKSVPVQVEGLTNIKAIAAGTNHNLALTQNGEVLGWGQARNGEIGTGSGDNYRQTIPVQIEPLKNITQIAAGGNFSLALASDGTIWSFGSNNDGALGNPEVSNRWPYNTAIPVQVKLNNSVKPKRIDAKCGHALALLEDGTVWAWGYNASGQSGQSEDISIVEIPIQVEGLRDVIDIAAGCAFSLAMTRAGNVFAWGRNEGGVMGAGYFENGTTPSPLLVRTGAALNLLKETPVYAGGMLTLPRVQVNIGSQVTEYEAELQLTGSNPISFNVTRLNRHGN